MAADKIVAFCSTLCTRAVVLLLNRIDHSVESALRRRIEVEVVEALALD